MIKTSMIAVTVLTALPSLLLAVRVDQAADAGRSSPLPKESVVGVWAHLAGVVRENCVELFVNGRLAATAKTGGCVPGNCGQGMEIGWDKANSPAEITDHFQGIIDDVQQFSAALSGEQIARQCRVK